MPPMFNIFKNLQKHQTSNLSEAKIINFSFSLQEKIIPYSPKMIGFYITQRAQEYWVWGFFIM